MTNPTLKHDAEAAVKSIEGVSGVTVSAVSSQVTNGVFHALFSGAANQLYFVDRASNVLGPWESGFTNLTSDSNGFFHPLGDHAQTSFSLDSQPVSDQQSRVYSNQIALDAVQSMELITGVAPAEYGDKTSLVAVITTKSGLGQAKPMGSASFGYGSFGTGVGSATLGLGNAKFGNFFAANGLRSGRYLDSPEFLPLHDIGNSGTLFDRVDFQLTPKDTLHVNLFGARSHAARKQ